VLVLGSLHSLCTRGLETASVKYLLNIFTADAKMHGGSGKPMAVAHSYCYKLLAYKTVFLSCFCRGNHWPRAVTIESSLKSGCGLSNESEQDSYNSTCKTHAPEVELREI